jgi:hypothetical protein
MSETSPFANGFDLLLQVQGDYTPAHPRVEQTRASCEHVREPDHPAARHIYGTRGALNAIISREKPSAAMKSDLVSSTGDPI